MTPLLQDAPGTTKRKAVWHKGGSRKRLWGVLMVAGAVLLIALVLAAAKWPFTQARVIAELQDGLSGKLKFGRFHQTYFPHPGCVAENVVLTNYGNLANAAPITISKLTIQGSFAGLFTQHVPVMRAEGVHVTARSARDFAGWKSVERKSKAVIDRLIISGSVLEFSRGEEGKALKFEISELGLQNPNGAGPIQFDTVIQNPEPPGEVRASGSLGPWKSDSPAQTPLVGSYSFRHAKLGVFHAIAGTLSSDGNFEGTLQQLQVSGQTDTPDFEVTNTGHKMHLATEFRARVNTRNGDVVLEQVMARLGKTNVASAGSIAGRPGEKGKMTALNLGVRSGRIQDFLYLFLRDDVPPMNGVFSFKGQATLPSGKEPFLQRLQMEGDFGIGDATLTNSATQSKLEELSERAEGEKDEAPERTVSDLKGHVVLVQGSATFADLSFRVPGAVARLHGNYSLISYRIDLHGKVFTKASLSQATTGVKSFLLKVISPVLKKNRRGGGMLVLSITGVYPHPVYNTAPVPHSM